MAKYRAQKETRLQKQAIEALNSLGLCFVFRIRNGGTYDPRLNIFRANSSLPGIPDVLGWHNDGRIVAIEFKFYEEGSKRVPLPTEDQKKFLQAAAKVSPYVGVAYSVDDALAILRNDQEKFPRAIRTWHYLPKEEKKNHEYADREKRPKKEKRSGPNCPWINWTDENKR